MHVPKSFLIILVLCLFFPFAQAFSTDSEKSSVLNFYPDCDYAVIDTVDFEARLGPAMKAVGPDDIEKATKRLISRIQTSAVTKGADAVILTGKEISIVNFNDHKSRSFRAPTHHTLAYSAELIRMCGEIDNLSNRTTPFDENGKKQKSISLGSIGGWETTIELDLPSNNKRTITELSSNSITLEGGAYGLPLYSSLADIQDIFGTPTLRLNADGEHMILAYGRSLWLVLKNDKLLSISSKQTWLSSEFINLLAFDDRFDDHAWSAQNLYVQNQPVDRSVTSADKVENGRIVFRNSDAILNIDVESFKVNNSDEQKIVTTHYALESASYKAPMLVLKQSEPKLLAHLNAYFREEIDALDIQGLNISPQANAWLSNSKSLHWYSGNLIIEKVGTSTNKILMLENALIDPVSDDSAWEINGITQFITMDEALEKLDEDVFYMGDTIEITKPHYVQELVFYESYSSNPNSSNGPQLLSSEITIY